MKYKPGDLIQQDHVSWMSLILGYSKDIHGEPSYIVRDIGASYNWDDVIQYVDSDAEFITDIFREPEEVHGRQEEISQEEV